MPTGGFHVYPERAGSAGEAGTSAPLLQRVFESIAAARGDAYDQAIPPTTAVGVENLAYARAIVGDLFGASQRLANQFFPGTMTTDGLLPRWERIFGLIVQPGDSEAIRQARMSFAWSQFATEASVQPVRDVITSLLGPIFVDVFYQSPSEALAFWPGPQGLTAEITFVGAGHATIAGLTGSVSGYIGNTITLANANDPANNGSYIVESETSPTSITAFGGSTFPDYGTGGAPGSPTIVWTVTNPYTPWMSTVAHLSIEVQQPAGYTLAQFYSALNDMGRALDELMPAWTTWDWWIASSHGGAGFYLDEPDLDLESFD